MPHYPPTYLLAETYARLVLLNYINPVNIIQYFTRKQLMFT